MTVSLPRWRWSSRPRLGATVRGGAWRRARDRHGTADRAVFFSRRRRWDSARRPASAARPLAASCSAFRRAPARPRLPRPCGFLRRGGALLRSARLARGRRGGALPRATPDASFLGLAQQAGLHLLAPAISSRSGGLRGCGAGGRASAPGAGRPAAGFGASAGGASPGRPRMRRFLTSTTTVFERPWLKLCLTLPVSTVRLRPSGGRVPSFGLSVWSAILFLRQIFFSRDGARGGFSAL